MEPGHRRRWLRIVLIVAIIIVLLLLLYYCTPTKKEAHDAGHAHTGGRLLALGDVVVTGFSGTVTAPGDQSVDRTFINLEGASARIFDVRTPGFAWDARFWATPKKHDISARLVGQVFGVAIDSAPYPNVYLSATSVYGLNLITPDTDRDADDLPQRVKNGDPDASWMEGQFGAGGGPGSIWKIDGKTGAISRFADIELNGRANHGPALGNIAYDKAHGQLFVSDFATGMIHRLAMDGRALGYLDHGVSGRPQENLPAIYHSDSTRNSISSATFDTLKPESWGFTPPERRVWALTVYAGRLYYSVWKPSQIWSIELNEKGNFIGSPRWELNIPGGENAWPVSDILFNASGRMIVAQRAGIKNSYDYSAFTEKARARVLRYALEEPDSPATKGRWIIEPEEYAVGFAGDNRNANGGIELGYAYDKDGKIRFDACEETLWATGEDLRGYKKVEDRFEPGGPLLAHGLQASPSGPVREFNTPPLVSYLTDYDDKLSNENISGHIGSVRIYRVPCGGGQCFAPANRARGTPIGGLLPPGGGGWPPGGVGGGGGTCFGPDCTGGACTGPNCSSCKGPNCKACVTCPGGCIGGDCCPGGVCPDPYIKEACMQVNGEFDCAPNGDLVYKVSSVQDKYGLLIDTLKAYSQTAGVSVTNGPHISLNPMPGVITLTGAAPGQTIDLDLCGHNKAAAATGTPFDCCRVTLRVRAPAGACVAP